jgi:hypothetical protein
MLAKRRAKLRAEAGETMEDEGGAGLAHAYVVPLTGQRISASLDRRFADSFSAHMKTDGSFVELCLPRPAH